MAKCVKLYSDGLSELVKSESGKWFYREWAFNNYVKCYQWTKWVEVGDLKNAEKKTFNYENLNGNEITEHQLYLEFESFNLPKQKFYFKLSNKKSVKGLRYRLPY